MPIEQRKNRGRREIICRCDCGNIVTVAALNLYSGNSKSCGCLAKELAHARSINNVVGKRFGRLIVLREADDSKWLNTRMLCKCDCGNEKSISLGDLLAGMVKSCGCLRKETTHNRCFDDITGKTYNELTALYPLNNRKWMFKCSCGREYVAFAPNVKRGLTKSCGHIGNSYAEHRIFKYLVEHNITFEHGVNPYADLVNPETNHKLYLDFIITRPDGIQIVIEHQGEQHFYENTSKAQNDFGRIQRELTDNIKRQYFSEHNIPFYETRYDEDYILRLENILTENGFTIST